MNEKITKLIDIFKLDLDSMRDDRTNILYIIFGILGVLTTIFLVNLAKIDDLTILSNTSKAFFGVFIIGLISSMCLYIRPISKNMLYTKKILRVLIYLNYSKKLEPEQHRVLEGI